MAITIKSKVKEVVDNPQALAIVKELLPSFDETNPGIKQAYTMPLKALLAFPQTGCPKDVQKALAEALEAANIE